MDEKEIRKKSGQYALGLIAFGLALSFLSFLLIFRYFDQGLSLYLFFIPETDPDVYFFISVLTLIIAGTILGQRAAIKVRYLKDRAFLTIFVQALFATLYSVIIYIIARGLGGQINNLVIDIATPLLLAYLFGMPSLVICSILFLKKIRQLSRPKTAANTGRSASQDSIA